MSDEKRREPFEVWQHRDFVGPHGPFYPCEQAGGDTVPVVVTPLLPTDPRPGETWVGDDLSELAGTPVEIMSAPYGHGLVRVRERDRPYAWHDFHVSRLRPLPKDKTFRLAMSSGGIQPWGKIAHDSYVSVVAPSREAALAKLADALTEVEE